MVTESTHWSHVLAYDVMGPGTANRPETWLSSDLNVRSIYTTETRDDAIRVAERGCPYAQWLMAMSDRVDIPERNAVMLLRTICGNNYVRGARSLQYTAAVVPISDEYMLATAANVHQMFARKDYAVRPATIRGHVYQLAADRGTTHIPSAILVWVQRMAIRE